MKGFLIDVVNKKAEVVECANDIHAWYKLLKCDIIEMPERRIGGKYYTIICDEEGLLKSNPVVSGISSDYNVMLVGNLLVVNSDYENGDVTDLTNEDVEHILNNTGKVLTPMGINVVLQNVDY